MSIAAMKQAFEALQQTVDNDTALWEQCEAITALRAAIAEAEKCEPAGLFYSNGKSIWYQAHPPYQSGAIPLYAAPQDVDMLLEKIDVLQQNLEMSCAAYIANTHPAPVEKCDHVPVTTFGGDYCIKCDAPIESNDYPVPAAAGWQLLPKEPTEAMLEAAFVYLEDADFLVAGVWQAMLQAAPKPGENHD